MIATKIIRLMMFCVSGLFANFQLFHMMNINQILVILKENRAKD